METLLPQLINAASYIIIAVLGIIGGRRFVGPNQDKLITTLQDLVDAQQLKIKGLEEENKGRDEKISTLEKQVSELKALTIFQAKEIESLTRRAGVIPK